MFHLIGKAFDKLNISLTIALQYGQYGLIIVAIVIDEF